MASKKSQPQRERLADDYLFDVRLVERHIARGLITRKEAEAYKDRAPDQAEQAETVDLGRLGSHAAARRSAP